MMKIFRINHNTEIMQNPKSDFILSTIISNTKPYSTIESFSDKPGIYGITLLPTSKPLKCGELVIASGTLLYIGMTKLSQSERDVKCHFASGRTRKSTLRRTLGAILLNELNLKLRPSSITVNYKFDNEGEEKLTEWMKANLGLGYYEYDGEVSDIAELERGVIKLASPPLNIKHNEKSPCYSELLESRNRCKILAGECHRIYK